MLIDLRDFYEWFCHQQEVEFYQIKCGLFWWWKIIIGWTIRSIKNKIILGSQYYWYVIKCHYGWKWVKLSLKPEINKNTSFFHIICGAVMNQYADFYLFNVFYLVKLLFYIVLVLNNYKI